MKRNSQFYEDILDKLHILNEMMVGKSIKIQFKSIVHIINSNHIGIWIEYAEAKDENVHWRNIMYKCNLVYKQLI